MRCSAAAQQLQLYIDGRLTMQQIRVLEAHVTHCATCQAELHLLQEVVSGLREIGTVAEPNDMTMRIIERVAVTPQLRNDPAYSLLRPSLLELLAVVFLATITTLGVILGQPSLRAALPFANGHDSLSRAFMSMLHLLGLFDLSTLTVAFWIVGTILGVCITLVVAGNEMRRVWLKAMMDHLPVW